MSAIATLCSISSSLTINHSLAGVPPVGVKSFAPCSFPLPSTYKVSIADNDTGYQSSPTAGDAACSYNGTVYAENGTSFPIPVSPASPSGGTSLPSPTGVAPIYPTGGNGTGVAGPTGTGGSGSSANPTGPGVPVYTGAAVANKAGGALAIFGLAAAALL